MVIELINNFFFFIKKKNLFMSFDHKLEIGKVGAISLYCYVGFIIYIFAENYSNEKIKFSEIKGFSDSSKEIAECIGNYALAFTVHNSVNKILSSNENK